MRYNFVKKDKILYKIIKIAWPVLKQKITSFFKLYLDYKYYL